MIILASKSPRRQELMKMVTPEFLTVPSGFDESEVKETIPSVLVRLLARRKAEAVAAEYPRAVIIGCDTVVVSPAGELFGIPKDRYAAKKMLRCLSGNIHQVLTGVCVIKNGIRILYHKSTDITFYQLSDREIDWYLNTGEPFDKAGAYGIQGKGGVFIRRIEGDYYSVVGLPVASLRKLLQKL